MENTINTRIAAIIEIKEMNVTSFSKLIGIAQTSLRDVVNGGAEPKFSTLEKIIIAEPSIDANWLLTGKGEMYKHNEAGRYNNVVEGDNKGVVGSGNTTGSIGGNHVSIGDTSNIKKIMNEEGVSIEFAQSVDSLQQTNAHLEIRIKDLETINASQSKTIETMQLLIDTLTKK